MPHIVLITLTRTSRKTSGLEEANAKSISREDAQKAQEVFFCVSCASLWQKISFPFG
jgi:hypothetical protein